MENTQVGPFLVLQKLGAHRRHNVYHARQVEQNRDVALKFIKLPPRIDRERALAKINHEVKVLKRIDHDHVVKLFGAGIHEDRVFLAHEIIEGEALSSLLARRGRLAHDAAIDYGTQIARGLDFLHQNELIHSKLTADKILIDSEGTVKIADLRLNRSKKRRWDAARRASLEIAAYMPPEQLLGEGATPKSDLYALGVLLYEMLTGKLPFEPQTMAQLARDKQSARDRHVTDKVMACPAWLDRLVVNLIQPNPDKRPHSARAVLLTLEQIRTVDQSKKAAAVEMTRGFSALTAGKDRTEARRLLGEKPEPEPESEVPLLQNVPFLVGSLAFICGLIALFAFWPFAPDRREMMSQANRLLASPNSEDWQDARRLYEKVMNASDPKLAEEAQKKYRLARRKSMIHRLRRGLSPLDKPEIKEFYKGFRLENERKPAEALAFYQRFIQNYDRENQAVYVYDEALQRRNRLADAKKVADEQLESIQQKLKEAEKVAEDPSTVTDAVSIWSELVGQYDDNPFLVDVLKPAHAGLAVHQGSATGETAGDSNATDESGQPPSDHSEQSSTGDSEQPPMDQSE